MENERDSNKIVSSLPLSNESALRGSFLFAYQFLLSHRADALAVHQREELKGFPAHRILQSLGAEAVIDMVE